MVSKKERSSPKRSDDKKLPKVRKERAGEKVKSGRKIVPSPKAKKLSAAALGKTRLGPLGKAMKNGQGKGGAKKQSKKKKRKEVPDKMETQPEKVEPAAIRFIQSVALGLDDESVQMLLEDSGRITPLLADAINGLPTGKLKRSALIQLIFFSHSKQEIGLKLATLRAKIPEVFENAPCQ